MAEWSPAVDVVLEKLSGCKAATVDFTMVEPFHGYDDRSATMAETSLTVDELVRRVVHSLGQGA